MQTILGAGGAIGNFLASELLHYTDRIRLVSRNPEKINPNDELLPVDLSKAEGVDKAIEGSGIVYVTIGFPYRYKVWKEMWPPFIKNVINACEKHSAKLVFFDNIYMYSADSLNPITEDLPQNPPSKKGAVRKEVADLITTAHKEGRIQACFARSADFYGPAIDRNSVINETVFIPLSKGKTANWLAKLNKRHSYTYVPDAARATAMLGNSDKSWGEAWHLPTAPDPYTGREWIERIANALGVKAKSRVAPAWMMQIAGLFDPIMSELPEMMYQYNRDYVFNSDKFESAFDFKPTPYEEGIKEVAKVDFGK